MNAKTSISHDSQKEIARRAYFIWEREGRPHGRQAEHWAMAEAEFLSDRPPEKTAAVKTPAKAKPAAAKPAKAGAAKTSKAAGAAKAVKTKKAAKPKKPTSPKA
jgi:prophage tail gpP-like protein